MLDFTKAQTIADEMLKKSKKYTKNFLQIILDNVYFHEEFFVENDLEFAGISRSPDDFSLNPDPLDVFTESNIRFQVFLTCFGKISIYFAEDVDVTSDVFRLLAECLEENGFIKDEEEKRFAKFVRRAQ